MRSNNRSSDHFLKLKSIPEDKFPKHVLIIPDGNGRWAKRLHQVPVFGHRKGAEILKKVIRALQDLPIDTLTVWAFSADNWKRSNEEIKGLMDIFEKSILEMRDELLEKNARFIHLGRKDRIPKSLLKVIEETEKITEKNKDKTFCIALDFGGQDQEIRIMKEVRKLPKTTNIDIDLLGKLRDGRGEVTPADLIIRTSGEQRTSDLGWLAQNAEFYSIKNFLPDSSVNDFINALIDYSRRERRFGARLNQWS